MTRRVVIYFAVTFLLGVFVGSGGSVLWKKYRHWNRPPLEERIARHLEHELSLSEDQSSQVRKIYADWMKKFSGIRGRMKEDMESEMQSLRENTRKQVEEILTSEQQERFAEMVREYDERHRRRRERRQRK